MSLVLEQGGSTRIEMALSDVQRARPIVLAGPTGDRHLLVAAQFVTPEVIDAIGCAGGGPLVMAVPPDAVPVVAEPAPPASDARRAARDVQSVACAVGQLRPARSSFPLEVAAPQGLLERWTHADAAVDLLRLAGLVPAAVLSRVGRRGEGSVRVAARELEIAELVELRRMGEPCLERTPAVALPTRHGAFQATAFHDAVTGCQYLAVSLGDVARATPVAVRVQPRCLAGEALGSLRCDCRATLDAALRTVAASSAGVLLHHPRSRCAHDVLGSADPVEETWDPVPSEILAALGVGRVRLLTSRNGPAVELGGFGVSVVDRLCIDAPPVAEVRHVV
jgi:3,4-dihydroxy 2-butanone 4-phosphate synthase/GTP cyclohydrolase II